MKKVRILLVIVAVACFAAALYSHFSYQNRRSREDEQASQDYDMLSDMRQRGQRDTDVAVGTQGSDDGADLPYAPVAVSTAPPQSLSQPEASQTAPDQPDGRTEEMGTQQADAQTGIDLSGVTSAQPSDDDEQAVVSQMNALAAMRQQAMGGASGASEPNVASDSALLPYAAMPTIGADAVLPYNAMPTGGGQIAGDPSASSPDSQAEPPAMDAALQAGASQAVAGTGASGQTGITATQGAAGSASAAGSVESEDAQDASGQQKPAMAGQAQMAENPAVLIGADPLLQGAPSAVSVPGQTPSPLALAEALSGGTDEDLDGMIVLGGAMPLHTPTPTPELPETTPTPVPEPTLAPTPTPDRNARTGPLAYEYLEKVTLDESKILPELREIYDINNDLVGWIFVDGTIIDYPVVQSQDSDYYLHHDFYKRDNANGVIILDTRCDPYTPSYNLVISGHHMKSGQMFGNLPEYYGTEKSWAKRRIIEFDTLMARKRYVIFAAFRSADYDEYEEGFRYNADIQYKLEADRWLKEIRENQLYDTGIDVQFGDEFITLTTCDRSRRQDGRFVVVARRIREGEVFENE